MNQGNDKDRIHAVQSRMDTLAAIVLNCIAERERLQKEVDRIEQEFVSKAATYLHKTGKRFKYTPKLTPQKWMISVGWWRTCSTMYRSQERGWHIGPKWKYLKIGKKARYRIEQFTARELTEIEREAIVKAEDGFSVLRIQGRKNRKMGEKAMREARKLGYSLQDVINQTYKDE